MIGARFRRRRQVLGFYDAESEAAVREAIGAAALKHAPLRFVVANVKENGQALSYFGLKEAPTPAVVIHDAPADKKYVRQPLALAQLDELLAAYGAGALLPTLKSEEPPASNDGPVKTLVAKTWGQDVVAGTNYLLEFYAPWRAPLAPATAPALVRRRAWRGPRARAHRCGHCKQLAPVYEQVGAHFAGRADVVIAKMDATANDVPDERFQVKGFPTLYLLTAGGEVKQYQGSRTKESLVEFVEAEAAGAAAGGAAEVKDEL